MATGRQRSVGIAAEASWGTAVAPAAFFNATESINEGRGRLREQMTFGSRALQEADPGRLRISGQIGGIHARPAGLGHILRAALGVPTTTGAAVPYSHEFVPSVANFAALAALPPYSITVKRSGSMVHRYGGGQLTSLTLRQPKDGILTLDTDWIAKAVSDVADTPLVLEQGTRFRYKHLAVERDGVAFDTVEDFSLTMNNTLEPEEVFDGTDVISAVEFGANSELSVALTLAFRDPNLYNDFKTNTTKPWVFTWTIDANHSLKLEIPQLNIGQWGSPTSGPGRMTISVQGQAEFNAAAGHELRATLTNEEATY